MNHQELTGTQAAVELLSQVVSIGDTRHEANRFTIGERSPLVKHVGEDCAFLHRSAELTLVVLTAAYDLHAFNVRLARRVDVGPEQQALADKLAVKATFNQVVVWRN